MLTCNFDHDGDKSTKQLLVDCCICFDQPHCKEGGQLDSLHKPLGTILYIWVAQ